MFVLRRGPDGIRIKSCNRITRTTAANQADDYPDRSFAISRPERKEFLTRYADMRGTGSTLPLTLSHFKKRMIFWQLF
jgi:hypothetical protein